MIDDVGYLAAFGGGLISFLSPCVLPIVPAYLSIITGLDVSELEKGGRQHLGTVARDTLLFIAGFSAVFVALGMSATGLGATLLRNQDTLTRLSGILVLAMAMFLGGSLVLRAPWLYQEKRFHPSPSRLGPFAAPVTGIAFGFGWTPCIGPVLTSVLAVAAASGETGRGALLLGAYSAGLGVPFLLTGLAFGKVSGALAGVRAHLRQITLASAVSLGFFGLLLSLNRLSWLTARMQEAARSVGLDWLVTLG